MLTIAEVAQIWHSVGVSTIPVRSDGTKRPAVKWAPYQISIPSLGEINHWWQNGHADLGLALICGRVSGNLEMTELEASAATGDCLIDIQNALDEMGIGFLWEQMTNSGSYMEFTPSGGIHFLYRLDGEVPGNTKLAHDEHGKVLAETRGEGGYVIVAPTSGLVHPTGDSWSMSGLSSYGGLATISVELRDKFHLAIKRALDKSPEPSAPVVAPQRIVATVTGNRPGDEWAMATSWRELLEEHDFRITHREGVEEYYARPGKNPRDGHSVTVNYRGSDLMKVFSTSIPGFESEATYTKFGALAQLKFNGDFEAATKYCISRGYGQPARTVTTLDTLDMSFLHPPVDAEVIEEEDTSVYTLDDVGTAQRLWRRAGRHHRYIEEEKSFYNWDGQRWRRDTTGAIDREMISLTDVMLAEAKTSGFEPLAKWARQCRNTTRLESVIKMMRKMPGATTSYDTFNTNRHLLNLNNGVLDLETGILDVHDPEYMQTRLFNASYSPGATCPQFEKFMSEVLPDEQMRTYVQRAMGYTLLGDADQRSLFLIYGPSGTGKSQFVELMRMLFGDYGTSAPAGTFKSSKDSGANNDLHRLRGRRFVTTSETADNAIFDEDLLKRITGRDQISSRALYQEFQDWTPECSVWIATNHPPKFNSDDDAVWARAKLVPFLTQFTAKDSAVKEIPDLARKVLIHEADGILNWLLAGLRNYLAHGLQEPDQVCEAAQSLREDSDSALKFLEDQLADSILEIEPTATMPAKDLYMMYTEWAKTYGERPLGARRFIRRLESGRPGLRHNRDRHRATWSGLQRTPGTSLLGTFQLPSS